MHNGTQQADVRVQIPCKIEPDIFELTQDDAETLFLLRRSFGKPTGLAESQCVTLELSGFEGADRAVLNGTVKSPWNVNSPGKADRLRSL